MGSQGPCGPCSEIHIDLRPEEEKNKISGATLVNYDHPQVIELWNLVFMEFNRNASGRLEVLEHKHVDRNGVRAFCRVLQQKTVIMILIYSLLYLKSLKIYLGNYKTGNDDSKSELHLE